MRGGARLTADVFGPDATGRGGPVSVRADEVEIAAGSLLSGSSFGAGDPAAVTVEAGQLRILGEGSDQVTGILGDAAPISTSNAGTVRVTARDIEIRGGGEIRTTTFGAGDAGTVEVVATDRLLISGAGASVMGFPRFTGIASTVEEGSTGSGGDITVTAGVIEMRSSAISGRTFATGDSGSVSVRADRLLLDGGEITTDSASGAAAKSGCWSRT